MNRWGLIAASFLVILSLLAACGGGGAKPPQSGVETPNANETPSADASTAAAPPESALEPVQTGPTSGDLIKEALVKGEIDEVTALKYQVFAQFKDSRLPAEYAGSVLPDTDSHIISELQARFFDLSAGDQTAMLPFLVPPVYRGSWGDPAFSPAAAPADPTAPPKYKIDYYDTMTNDLPCDYLDQENWDTITAMHSPVRFWWLKSRPGDSAIVQRYLTAMDDDIWPKLTKLMGRTPKVDGGYVCDGGSAEFDVYITPEIERSYAAPLFPPGCKDVPSYIVLNPSVSDGILAHEFMHAIQFSYKTSADCVYPGNYAWLSEATASWSQNFVYPKGNEEHQYIPWFFTPAGEAGEAPNLEMRNDKHEYGAHIFFFYLTNSQERPEIVRDAWDNTESMASLESVDKAISDGLDEVWPDFAVKNFNEPPFDDYQIWDALNVKPSGASLEETTASAGEYFLPDVIDHLSIDYQWFTFEEDAHLVAFYNGMNYTLEETPIDAPMGLTQITDGTTQYKFTRRTDEAVQTVRVQALYRVAGEVDWVLEDWTDRPYSVFCRDAKTERLTDLVIITSNSAKSGSARLTNDFNPHLSVMDTGCWRYSGEASVAMIGEGDDGLLNDTQNVPRVVFERMETHDTYAYPFMRFKLAEGEWERTYQLNVVEGDCVGNGEASGPLIPQSYEDYGDELMILYGAFTGPSILRYTGEGNPPLPIEVTFICPENEPTQPEPYFPWLFIDALTEVLGQTYTVGEGGVLEGSGNFLEGVEGATMIYTWNFVPLIEP